VQWRRNASTERRKLAAIGLGIGREHASKWLIMCTYMAVEMSSKWFLAQLRLLGATWGVAVWLEK
jgi:hypothetical protein